MSESTYVVMLAAGHVRLVAVGSELVTVVPDDEEKIVAGEAIEVGAGVPMTVDVGIESAFVVEAGEVDKVPLVSGHVAPGLQGSTEQQPLNPFWQT